MDPTNNERDVDRWLTTALSEYSKAEPRAGLEGRVLANLRAERERVATRRGWWWAVGAVTAAAAVVAGLWMENAATKNPGRSAEPLTATHRQEARITPPSPQAFHPATRVVQSRSANRPIREETVERKPKLAQFPSPQPLSEQEKILASYVTNYPKHAALIAQARTEALRRDHEEEMSAPASSREERSQQRVQ